MTVTLASLPVNGQRSSAAIDNTVNQDLDAGVMVKLRSAASGTSSTGYVNVYAYGSADGGSTYSDNLPGTDASVNMTSPPNARIIGVMNVVANSVTYVGGPFSVGNAFGYLPGKWGTVVENKSGAILDGSAGNFTVFYERVRGTTL